MDQVTNVFKRIQDAKVQAVKKLLQDEKTLNAVKTWSNQATERMRRVTEYRQQVEEKLESVINEERETAERRQIDIQIEAQRKITAERLEVLEREQQLKEQLTRRIYDENDGETRALAKPQAVKLQRYTMHHLRVITKNCYASGINFLLRLMDQAWQQLAGLIIC